MEDGLDSQRFAHFPRGCRARVQGDMFAVHPMPTELQHIRILETCIILVLYVMAVILSRKHVNNTLKRAQLERTRRKIIIKAINLFLAIGVLVLTASVWGLEQRRVAVFAGTIFTALGIAFFAQWSLLSNITASIILFFNHPLKLGDKIRVLDKDYPFEGEVTDLAYFFVHLHTEKGEIITVPNSMVLQKAVAVLSRK
jgi:small-conductance mechanosensitive channel